jgi:hypothetical protein
MLRGGPESIARWRSSLSVGEELILQKRSDMSGDTAFDEALVVAERRLKYIYSLKATEPHSTSVSHRPQKRRVPSVLH